MSHNLMLNKNLVESDHLNPICIPLYVVRVYHPTIFKPNLTMPRRTQKSSYANFWQTSRHICSFFYPSFMITRRPKNSWFKTNGLSQEPQNNTYSLNQTWIILSITDDDIQLHTSKKEIIAIHWPFHQLNFNTQNFIQVCKTSEKGAKKREGLGNKNDNSNYFCNNH